MISRRQISNISDNFLILIALIFSLLFSFVSGEVKSQNRSSSGLSTIIIDAGHGGKDPGAVVGSAREKDIVLDIALRLGRLVKNGLPEVRVIYTRNTDYFVPLFKRSVIANNNNADLFISIHANFCQSPAVKGTETYVLGLHRTQDNLDVAKKENSVILLEEDYSKRYEGFDPNSPESYIMFELIQDNHIEQSVTFAGMVQDLFRQNAGRSDRDVRQAGFLVLRETAMPSVLIETGYLSNKAEAAYLMTAEGRETIAYSIFNSLQNYKFRYDSRLNLASGQGKKNLIDSGKAEKKSSEKPASANTTDAGSEKKSNILVREKDANKKEVNKKKGISISKSDEEPNSVISVSNSNKAANAKNPAKKEAEDEIKKNREDKEDRNIMADNSKTSISGKVKGTTIQNKTANGDKKDPEKESPANDQDQYSYGIQIAASKVKLSKSFRLFKGINDLREMEIAGYYKYYGFESDSKRKTLENLAVVHQRIPDAFVVIFKNGIPVPLKDVPKK